MLSHSAIGGDHKPLITYCALHHREFNEKGEMIRGVDQNVLDKS